MAVKVPSDALSGPSHTVGWILGGASVLAIAVSAVMFGPTLAAQVNPAPSPSPTVIAVGGGSYAAPIVVSPDSIEGSRTAAAAQAAAEKAAADAATAAAAQAAADAAAAAATPKRAATSSGPVKCPAGSQANSGDGVNDTSCFPEICFHITLPDPAHPECVTAFKP